MGITGLEMGSPLLALLTFGQPAWLWPAAVILVLAGGFLCMSYARLPARRWVRVAAAALKMLGLAALLACIVEPTWTEQRVKPGANLLAIIADNSRSMTLADGDGLPARGETLRALVAGERSGWKAVAGEQFKLHSYLADARLRATADFTELKFDGHSSSLLRTLQQAVERHKSQPLAGILLFTDGAATDLTPDSLRMNELPPVYPIVIGGEKVPRDLSVGSASVSQTSFEDAPVTIQAQVRGSGYGGSEVKLELTSRGADGSEQVEVTQTIAIPRDTETAMARMQIRPAAPGVLFYQIRVQAEGSEATRLNNETALSVDRGAGPHRVLYVGGRPNWEYKFLQRAVQGDDQTQLVGLIRIARREPKFEFRGRTGESSNPLFRGFGDQSAEDIERYDQPVLVRLNTLDDQELRGGFPKTAEQLFGYHAIVLDDVEAEFFTPEQMTLISRFVSERGGGFLMMGGAESFADGKYQRTPIADLLPVYLGREAGTAAEVPWQIKLTREGSLEPWLRLRTNEADERSRLAGTPPVDVLNRVGGAKPAAVVAATVIHEQQEYPALVTQRFGNGRSGALLLGDLWHTGLGDETQSKDLAKAWRQMVRWLVADVPPPVELRVTAEAGNERLRVEVRVRDTQFTPVDDALLTLKVESIAGGVEAVALSPEPSADEPGLFTATFVPPGSGSYKISTSAVGQNGEALGTDETGWSVDYNEQEFRSLTPNRALMEKLATETGGRLVGADELDDFARELPKLQAPVRETSSQPLWHTPYLFLVALGCLVGEWGLRRANGLS